MRTPVIRMDFIAGFRPCQRTIQGGVERHFKEAFQGGNELVILLHQPGLRRLGGILLRWPNRCRSFPEHTGLQAQLGAQASLCIAFEPFGLVGKPGLVHAFHQIAEPGHAGAIGIE